MHTGIVCIKNILLKTLLIGFSTQLYFWSLYGILDIDLFCKEDMFVKWSQVKYSLSHQFS